MSAPTPKNITTLEALQQEKLAVLQQLRTQKQVLDKNARTLFAPLPAAVNKGNSLMRAFNTGMAVFDGAMLGIKLMRKVRKFFQ